jgi:hypothetical protein
MSPKGQGLQLFGRVGRTLPAFGGGGAFDFESAEVRVKQPLGLQPKLEFGALGG